MTGVLFESCCAMKMPTNKIKVNKKWCSIMTALISMLIVSLSLPLHPNNLAEASQFKKQFWRLTWVSDSSCLSAVVSTVALVGLTVRAPHIIAWGCFMPGGIDSTLLSLTMTVKMSTHLDSSMVYSASCKLTAEAHSGSFFLVDERTMISLRDEGVHHTRFLYFTHCQSVWHSSSGQDMAVNIKFCSRECWWLSVSAIGVLQSYHCQNSQIELRGHTTYYCRPLLHFIIKMWCP